MVGVGSSRLGVRSLPPARADTERAWKLAPWSRRRGPGARELLPHGPLSVATSDMQGSKLPGFIYCLDRDYVGIAI
jgi:hypothetical protein